MRWMIVLVMLGFLSVSSFANNGNSLSKISEPSNNSEILSSIIEKNLIDGNIFFLQEKKVNLLPSCLDDKTQSNSLPYFCTVSVYTKLSNGTIIEGTIKIDGISWFDCLAIKIYDIFSNKY